jgi:Kef-type K+ transport system membrane component KefB
VFQLMSDNVDLPLSLITDIELYTTSSCLVALFYSHYAAQVPHYKTPTAKDILTKRNAVIWNSIAITINLVVLITYFIFIPITQASDGKFKAGYFFTIKTIAFLLSTTAILGHFFIVKFALIEDDASRVTLILCIWVAFNLLFEN